MFKRSDDQENLIRKDIQEMSLKLDRLEAALSKEGFKVPQTKVSTHVLVFVPALGSWASE